MAREVNIPRGTRVAAVAVTALLALLWAGAARADHPATAAAGEEAEVRAYEGASLGQEHAAEHAAQRRQMRRQAKRWKRLSPAQRRAALRRQQNRARALARKTTSGPASQIGRWTTSPFTIPNYAIQSVVLPTGKVLFWGYPAWPARGNEGKATVWDPRRGTGPSAFKSVPPPLYDTDDDGNQEPAPIYCSGQSLLANGEVLVAGGNQVWPGDKPGYTMYSGARIVLTFNPWTESWTKQPNMEKGRWYPTQVELGDGRTILVSGYSDEAPGRVYNTQLEIFTPDGRVSASGWVDRVPSGDRDATLYPHMFSLPNSDVLLAGAGLVDSAILDTDTFTYRELSQQSRLRDAGTGTLMPSGPNGSWTAMQIGGYDLAAPESEPQLRPALSSAESIDASQPNPTWQPAPSLNVPRASMNTVLLPDGSMVTVGGGKGYHDDLGSYVTYEDGRARQVELYDPRSQSWRLGPAQLEDRAYHSTAVLLPDGRVMSAGDDLHPTENDTFSTFDTAEIYSPPYLFRKGKRPKIQRAPTRVGYGRRFPIRTKSPKIRRVTLVAPGATTHGVDMHQRHLTLKAKRTRDGLIAKAPRLPGAAPPGYYMLFILNKKGEPSKAKWVQLGPFPKKNRKKK